MIRRFYVVPLRDDVAPRAVREAVRRLAEADLYIPTLYHSSAAVCIDGRHPTIVWESCFDSAEAQAEYGRSRYHGSVIDRYLLHDSPQRVGRLDETFACGYHTDTPANELRRGIRRLILLSVGREADVGDLARIAGRARLRVSGLYENTHQRRDAWWRPYRWTHVWEQGFRTRRELQEHIGSSSEAAVVERAGFRGGSLEVGAFEVLTYPIWTRRRRMVSAPSDYPDERLVQTFICRVRPEDVASYLSLLREVYDPAVKAAGMRLESRSSTSSQLGELVTVQSTWSMDGDQAFDNIRARLLEDERWHLYAKRSETLIRAGWRHLGYAERG
jgi:hypothetical protein